MHNADIMQILCITRHCLLEYFDLESPKLSIKNKSVRQQILFIKIKLSQTRDGKPVLMKSSATFRILSDTCSHKKRSKKVRKIMSSQ